MNYLNLRVEFISTTVTFINKIGWSRVRTYRIGYFTNDSFWITPSGQFKGELLFFNVAFKVTKI
ncbi:hypothetical protein NIES4072_45980 [Nostoc commune NIES-4072]|uniref:Uncharacterized protein n=1 Tax=Nostoc commune NIES-4072 TaxID=2005467 RepID=A0A2R5FQ83_NOSCO|nr:hypothetical protein [Nostoc commune]BBD68090.1 hypothetical protein NIES4070_44850 [Nostoc commune HK-02]GBG20916.1 hypothetical protein NIES4072_45980 [Nostoc commune NIES-4072]